ncbi:ABC transporter substrate-binding protein [Martelella mediterranea]|uniref:Dipeptide-binding protein n=1 Tax=Martelella mediterranea DSM 17316 TaxID=1122214 RepID=A0A1U9YVW9_9HYPH|nr:ABC transporter substrate-binding protein [Martelella mediterranea]AQZ49593.1 Dipeptide-binding protein [Martelella mediterranea DSM 17316]
MTFQFNGWRKCVSAVALAAALAVPGAAFAETLTIASPGDAQPKNILPIRAGNTSWVQAVFEPLVRIMPGDDTPQPVLAKSWTVSEDGKTVTFELEDGVTFHSGRPFTSADVKFTLETAADKASASQFSFIASAISEIATPSDTEVVLTLERPMPNLFEFLSQTVIVDKDTYDQRADGKVLVGTGPYKFADWVPGASIRMVSYDGYRDPSAHAFDEIDIAVITDPTAMISALRSNRAQLAMQMQPRDAIELSGNPMYQTVPTAGSIYPLGVNVTDAPFDDKRVRQAVGYAIDRDRINQQIFDGLGTPTDLFWPTSDEQAQHYAYNPDKARELLKEAGAEGATATVALHALPSQRAIFEIVQNNLTDAGFKVEANILDPSTYGQQQIAGELGPVFIQLHGMDGLSPATLLSAAPALRDGNPSHFWTDEYLKLRDAVQSAANKQASDDAVKALGDYLLDQAFNLNILSAPTLSVSTTNLEGVEYTTTGYIVFNHASGG